jgi:hypothetical protein
MSHSAPVRDVKCQKCSWQGTRRYGADGILCEPCPECGRLVTYAVVHADDQPITTDLGQAVPKAKPPKFTPEQRIAIGERLAASRKAVAA